MTASTSDQSQPHTGPCVSAGAQVPEDVRAKVRDALLKLDNDEETVKVLIELGVTKFVEASPKDYSGNEKLLKSYLGY